MVATRFGSSCEAAAHLEMESAQYWISILKMGEIPVEVTGGSSAETEDAEDGNGREERFDGMESGIESKDAIGSGLAFFNANVPSRTLSKMTAKGTMTKPEKQPLPASSRGAACISYESVFVERARGMCKFSFLGLRDPGSKR